MRVPRVLGLGCRGIRALGLLGTYRVLVDGSLSRESRNPLRSRKRWLLEATSNPGAKTLQRESWKLNLGALTPRLTFSPCSLVPSMSPEVCQLRWQMNPQPARLQAFFLSHLFLEKMNAIPPNYSTWPK